MEQFWTGTRGEEVIAGLESEGMDYNDTEGALWRLDGSIRRHIELL